MIENLFDWDGFSAIQASLDGYSRVEVVNIVV